MANAIAYTGRPEADAAAVLARFWSFGNVVSLPVDPILIAQSAGLQVWEVQLENDVGGMLVKRPNTAYPEIYLAHGDPRVRKRFTCAHELGHWVKRLDSPEGDWAFVDKRNELSGTGTDPVETYANQFAAALLMPASRVRELADGLRLDALARMFNVSTAAMAFRLRNLGIDVRA